MNSPKETKSIADFFSISIWAIKKIFKIAPFETAVILFFLILEATLPVLNSYIYGKVIDQVSESIINKLSISQVISITSPLAQYIVLSALLGAALYIVYIIKGYFQFTFQSEHFKKLELELDLKISSLDIADLESHEMINKLRRADDSLNRIRTLVFSLFKVITNLIYVGTTFLILYKIQPALTIFIILLSLPNGVFRYIFINKAYENYNSNLENYRKRSLYLSTLSNSTFIPQNRLHAATEKFAEKFRVIHKMLSSAQNAIEKKETIIYIFFQAFDAIKEIVASYYFLSLALIGKITLGEFSFYVGRSTQLSDKIESTLTELSSLIESAYGVRDAKEIFELKNKIISGDIKLEAGAPKIEFKNVSFKYEGSKTYAIKNLNLIINPRDEIALVGENGAGKSTLIKLLLRFYDVTEGEILINNINIKNIDLDSLYSQVGSLLQEYQIHGVLNIKENIGISERGAIDIQRVEESAIQAEAHDFIKRLPNKYETLVRKDLKDGTELSTGQKQKIALARLFYSNSNLMILDEPTASVDPVSEYKIFKRVFNSTHSKTVVIISHRFSTVRNAQKIYVIDKGRIIESGSHSELMKINGIYADAFNKQAEGYTKED
jgi:ABC-type multidrug transport system fused ATPase/permease subunit